MSYVGRHAVTTMRCHETNKCALGVRFASQLLSNLVLPESVHFSY